MIIIDLDLNNSVLSGSKQEAYSCVQESFQLLETANTLVESLRDWESTSNVDPMVYSDIQLVNCENMLNILETPGIDAYRRASFSKIPALEDRLTVFQYVREELYPILNNVVLAYVNLTEEEKNAIRELSLKILEQLSFFLFYEFNLDKTALSIQKKREIEVNEIILDYVKKESFSLEQKVLFMLELYIKYRLTIPSFDFSDEEIDMFYYNTGVCAHSILENIDILKPEIVHKLASGEVSPEEVLFMISENSQDKEVAKINVFS